MWPLEHLASTSTNQQIPEHRDRAQWSLQSGDLSLLIFGMLLYFQASAAPSLFLLLSLPQVYSDIQSEWMGKYRGKDVSLFISSSTAAYAPSEIQGFSLSE